MSAASTDSPVTKIAAQPKMDLPGEPKSNSDGKWPLQRWILFIALVFIAHVAAIFIFGARKFPPARAATNVPHLQLADNSSEMLALDDPTLFALPHARDFSSLKMPSVQPPAFRWTEAPRLLALSAEKLGATFNQFMQTNSFAGYQLDFKPSPKLSAPALSLPVVAENSTLQTEGGLKGRSLAEKINLPSLLINDVLAPDRVQVLVSANGDVASAVLLESSGDKNADARALGIALSARFSPAPQPVVGEIIFNWRTSPQPQ